MITKDRSDGEDVDDIASHCSNATSLLVHEIEHIFGYIAAHIAAGTKPTESTAVIWIDGNEAIVMGLDRDSILVTCSPIFAELHRGGGNIDFATSPVSEEDLVALQILLGGKGSKTDRNTIIASRTAMAVGNWMATHCLAALMADPYDGDADAAYVVPVLDIYEAIHEPLQNVIDGATNPFPWEVLQDLIKQTAPLNDLPQIIAPTGLNESLRTKFGSLKGAMPAPKPAQSPQVISGGSNAVN